MGSFYRSQHELVGVFRAGKGHKNRVRLGRFGRDRSNLWRYAGANVRLPKWADNPLAHHPTPKPVMLIADAIRDSSDRGDIILDTFMGSGTLLLAAERTGRRGFSSAPR